MSTTPPPPIGALPPGHHGGSSTPGNPVSGAAPPPTAALAPPNPPKRKRKIRVMALCSVVVLLLVAEAAVAWWITTSSGRSLAFSFSPRQSVTYLFSETTHDEQRQAKQKPRTTDTAFTAKEQWGVATIDGEGATTLSVTQSDCFLTTNGTHSEPADSRSSMTLGPTGVITNRPTLNSGGAQSSGVSFNQLTPILPDWPATPEDEWDTRYIEPLPFGMGGIEVTGHTVYVRDARVDGTDVAVLRGTATMPLNYSLTIAQSKQIFGTLPFATENAKQRAAVLRSLRGFSVRYEGVTRVSITSVFDSKRGQMIRSTLVFSNTITETIGKDELIVPWSVVTDSSHSSMTFTRV